MPWVDPSCFLKAIIAPLLKVNHVCILWLIRLGEVDRSENDT